MAELRDIIRLLQEAVRHESAGSMLEAVVAATGHLEELAGRQERLFMLVEECSEVAQIACKTLRHGPTEYHPLDSTRTPNQELLRREVTDQLAVLATMQEAGEIGIAYTDDIQAAWEKKLRYAHHQEKPDA